MLHNYIDNNFYWAQDINANLDKLIINHHFKLINNDKN